MNNKKYLTLALVLALSAPLTGCGNDNKTEEAPAEETVEEVETPEENEDIAVEPDPSNEIENKDAGEKGIYDLEFGYLPEGFVENFKDEKNDLRTVEYMAEKNPAKKITIQITEKDERLDEIVTIPDDAEDITIGDVSGKFWDDGSFNYIVVKDGKNHIYTRSTLEKEEAEKIVEAIK